MRTAHREAQNLFLMLGRSRGYVVRRQFSPTFPTDGVWLTRLHLDDHTDVPVAAIEVICSESPKTVLGSVSTLVNVSPTLAVILIHEEEIARRMVRDGRSDRQIERHLTAMSEKIDHEIATNKQRIERWSFEQLKWRCRHLLTGPGAAAA